MRHSLFIRLSHKSLIYPSFAILLFWVAKANVQFGSYCLLDSINILDYDTDDIASHSWVQIHLQMAVSVVLSHVLTCLVAAETSI